MEKIDNITGKKKVFNNGVIDIDKADNRAYFLKLNIS